MRKVDKDIAEASLEAIYETAKRFKGDSAVVEFIDNILTDYEKAIVGKRLLVARLKLQGYTHNEINELTHISPNTHSYINKWLDGQFKGYYDGTRAKKALKAKELERSISKFEASQIRLGTLDHIAQKYPLHFLLFKLPSWLNTQTRRKSR